MHRRCSVCVHPRLAEINADLRTGATVWKRLAREMGLSGQALHRHCDNHDLGVLEPTEAIPSKRKPKPTLEQEAQAKGEFLGTFRQTGDVKAAIEAAGVSRSIMQRWLEHDEAFSLRFNQARAEVVDHLEATALERATQGGRLVRKVFRNGNLYEEIHEWRPSDAALIKLLSSLKPEIYGDKLQITQTQIVKAVAAEAWAGV